MFKELDKKDLEYFKELEEKFSDVFNQGSIELDFNSNPFNHILVYLIEGKIVGFINYYVIYDRVEIANFNVLDFFQNNGIGSKLLKYVIDKNKDLVNITLEVRSDNSKAIYLYTKFGFKNVSIRKNYYNNCDGILMERKCDNMKDVYILGIESSCDETSFSIVKNGCEEIATSISSQIDIHREYGGVVPEIASRAHIKNVTFVLEDCLEKANMTMDQIDGIAITYGPGLVGSLLVGIETAKTLSWIYNKPLIPVHHLTGHIYANNLVKEMEFPLLCLVISGGHTELVLMEDHYKFKILGSTLDDAVGECYDKVGRVIDVAYPGGPIIDKMAHIGKHSYNLPLPLNDDSYNFSFSGLKSAVINLNHNIEQKGLKLNKEDLCCSFQDIVVESLTKKTFKAIRDYKIKNLILAGGVSANRGIRERIEKECIKNHINYTFPEIKYCTDNAAMIAASGYFAYKLGRRADLTLNAKSSCSIEEVSE